MFCKRKKKEAHQLAPLPEFVREAMHSPLSKLPTLPSTRIHVHIHTSRPITLTDLAQLSMVLMRVLLLTGIAAVIIKHL